MDHSNQQLPRNVTDSIFRDKVDPEFPACTAQLGDPVDLSGQWVHLETSRNGPLKFDGGKRYPGLEYQRQMKWLADNGDE